MLETDTTLQNLTLNEQVKLHREISTKIDELEAQKKELGAAIMKHMVVPVLNVPGYRVRRCHRLSIAVSVETARNFQATKMEEVVDKDKIKALYNLGQPIDGVSEVKYIQVSHTT